MAWSFRGGGSTGKDVRNRKVLPAQGPLAGTGPPRTATAARGVARPTARSPQAAG
jgi:hypothetical protein